MTQNDVIRIAREAGFKMENSAAIQAAEAFAKLVAAHEREACAKLFDVRDNGIGFYEPHEPAEMIRARGNT